MPFTFSHPALIIPFKNVSRKWISFTGLIVGSVVPDFEYFIRMSVTSIYSHTLLGLFWFDIPLSILLAFCFHSIVRNVLIDSLPQNLFYRFWKYKEFNWLVYFKNNFLIISYSILFGAASHLIWDSFTHSHGFFVLKFNVLSKNIQLMNFNFPVYKILQHLSSLIGGIFVLYVIFKMPKTVCNNINKTKKNNYWIATVLLCIIIFILRFLIKLEEIETGNIIVCLISSMLLSIFIVSIMLKNKFSKIISVE